MNILHLNQNQFSDTINIYNNVYKPLIKFPNEKELMDILLKKKFKGKYFPFPIFFGITKNNYSKLRSKKKISFYYKKKYFMHVEDVSFYKIDKNKFGKTLFGENYPNHPFFLKFNKYYAFMNFKVKKIYKKNFNSEFFISPTELKKKYKINNLKKLASFHTRNVPHKAHQWIHYRLINKYTNLLIQPLIGQYKKNEYKDKTIISTNKFVTKLYKSQNFNVIFAPYFSYPRYGGPREAALHAIVRRNFGCSHFWVGRDHAGVKNFYRKYSSMQYCKQNEKRIGIQIVTGNEPYYCSACNKITNKKCCSLKNVESISGTKIRKLIIKNKPIPQKLMLRSIALKLSKKSLV